MADTMTLQSKGQMTEKEKEYLKIDEIAERYQISKRTIQRLLKDGKFPTGKKVSPKIRLWSNIEIETWLDNRDTE